MNKYRVIFVNPPQWAHNSVEILAYSYTAGGVFVRFYRPEGEVASYRTDHILGIEKLDEVK